MPTDPNQGGGGQKMWGDHPKKMVINSLFLIDAIMWNFKLLYYEKTNISHQETF